MTPALLRGTSYAGVLAAMLAVERVWPFAPGEQRKARRISFHVGLSVANTAILGCTVGPLTYAAVAAATQIGLAGHLGLGGIPEIAATVVAFDLWDYWMHLANHKIGFLWRFHRAHHSDMEIDVTTASRFHIGELIISGGAKVLMILLWGPSVWGLVAFEALLTTASQFHHANLNIPLGAQTAVEKVVVSPRMHRCHHSLHTSCFNHNFSTILSVWDRVFRSYHWARDVEDLQPVGLFRPRGPSTMALRPFLLTPLEG
jgi:sterol desaturase/sphingolipid hydroxylase (fatty acid hydroxylase superfamily)